MSQRLLYGPDGRLLHLNGRLVTDLNGAPCCGCGGGPSECRYLPTNYPCPGQCGTPGGWTGSRQCSVAGVGSGVWTCAESPQQCCCPQSSQVFYDLYERYSRSAVFSGGVNGAFGWSRSTRTCTPSGGCINFDQNYGCNETGNCSGGTSTTQTPWGQGRFCGGHALDGCIGPVQPFNGQPDGSPGSFSRTYARSCNQQASSSLTVTPIQPQGTQTVVCQYDLRSVPPCLPLDRGACCCEGTGQCLDGLSQSECFDVLGNSIWRAGLTCAEVQCAGPPGVCCFPVDNFCVPGLPQQVCYAAGGFHIPGGSCTPEGRCDRGLFPSLLGACCLPNGQCVQDTEASCALRPGTWRGLGSQCTPNPCGPTGACCTPTGCVGGQTQAQCFPNAWYQGQGCGQVQCSPSGTCCIPGQGCSVRPCQECMDMGGTCLPQKFCTPFLCAFGACCRPDGSCSQTYRGICEATPGAVFIEGQPCSACPTVQTNPFNPVPMRDFIRVYQPGDVPSGGCGSCGGVGAVVI